MQIAINIILFVLGFTAATLLALRPRKARKDLLHGSTSHLSQVTIDDTEAKGSDIGPRGKHVTEEDTTQLGVDYLLTKEQVEDKYSLSTWQRLAYEEFKTTILAKGSGLRTFPCVYATMGFRAGDHRYIFLHSADPSEPRNIKRIAPALKAYLRLARTLGPHTSLVILAAPDDYNDDDDDNNDNAKHARRPPPPPSPSVAEYHDRFWALLRGLRIWDPTPWPTAAIPPNTASNKWAYCFDGTPLFPVAFTPAHQRRWSRHAPVPLIALQPKWVLDRLLRRSDSDDDDNGDNDNDNDNEEKKRDAAVGRVRKLLAEYDQVEISPHLTAYGQGGTSEVHQLCLRDDSNETVECPFQDFDKGGVASATSSRRSSWDAAREE